MEFDYDLFRAVVLSYAGQAVLDLVTVDGELADLDEPPYSQAELWAWGLVRKLLERHHREELPRPWKTDFSVEEVGNVRNG